MRPKIDPVYDPSDKRYWDPRDLEQELERVFTICHGCRMCVGYCPSFPELFKRVDGYEAKGSGEVDAFSAADYDAVNDLCYQCKLCYFKCPYTPDDGHAFALDFPRLMLRQRAQRAARDGITLQDQVLGEPQLLGKLASGIGAPAANFVSAFRLTRKAQEKTLGISADFKIPPFARQSLERWHRDHTPRPEAGSAGDVAIFATCTTNYNLPAAGRAAIQVLEHNGLRVHFPVEQTCCGMPNLDGGDMDAALLKAKQNLDALIGEVEAGRSIVVPGPTCSYVLKKEYPELLGSTSYASKAKAVAAKTFDLMEFLRIRLRSKELRTDFTRAMGKIAYHAACHLRAQKIGAPAQQLLERIPDTSVEVIEQCSAVDGTWGMKAQYYELGRQYAKKLVRETRDAEADLRATDCPLSGLRLEKELGPDAVVLHPIEILNDAYGLPSVRTH